MAKATSPASHAPFILESLPLLTVTALGKDSMISPVKTLPGSGADEYCTALGSACSQDVRDAGRVNV
jgi:hypothetical protein